MDMEQVDLVIEDGSGVLHLQYNEVEEGHIELVIRTIQFLLILLYKW
jgi:hypothetical protein